MLNNIHSSAIIGSNVKLGVNNTIGPNVIIEGNITIGDNNLIGVNTIISNNVVIGDGNKFIGAAFIGALGEMGTKGDIFLEDGLVIMGNNNTIREFVTVHSPVRKQTTKIGNNCYLMAKSHVPHDVEIGNNVVMATASLVGGGCVVHDYAYIGLGAISHQWISIGESAMIGLQAGVNVSVPPFCTVFGTPARIIGLNKVGAMRRGFSEQEVSEVEFNLKEILEE